MVRTPLLNEKLVLAIFLSTRGFGFAVFEGPTVLVDWGVKSARGTEKNRECLRKIRELLDFYHPDIITMTSASVPVRDAQRGYKHSPVKRPVKLSEEALQRRFSPAPMFEAFFQTPRHGRNEKLLFLSYITSQSSNRGFRQSERSG